MSRKKPVNLGHLSFPMRTEALKYFSDLLKRTEIGTHLEGEDFDDVEALLSGHPDAQTKIGDGIRSITVEDDTFNYKCFHVIRSDGSRENFSYKKCINGDSPPFTNFSVACRSAVKAEIHAFKAAYFEKHQNAAFQVQCPETKIWMTFSEAHADHRPPLCFSVIVKSFSHAKAIDLTQVSYSSEDRYGHIFTDEKLSSEFAKWHKGMAQLRVIHSKRNSQKAHMGRVTPTKADHQLI
jgi:hypothetical protein